MLRDEIARYTELSGNDGEHTPIGIIGAFLDGYETGLKDRPKGEWKRMSDLPEDKDDRYECSRCSNVVHYKKRMDLYTFNSWCGRCGSNNNPNRYDER